MSTPPKETASLDDKHPQLETINDEPAFVPPDGGLTAWLQVVGAWFLFVSSWGFVNAFGVYQTYYEAELLSSSTPSAISWIGSLQGFLLMVIGVLTGPLYDRGYFRQLVATGTFLVVFGIMMTSVSTKYYQVLLAQSVCVGLGTGCLFVPSVAVISQYFTTRRSLATGFATTGGSLGGVIYSVAFRGLVHKIGFGWATRFLGFLTLAMLLIAQVLMKQIKLSTGPRSLLLPGAFKEAPYTLASVAFLLSFLGMYVPFFYIQSYASQLLHLNPNLSFQLLTIMNVSSVAGRVVPNILADKIGPINTMIPFTFAAGIMAFGWIGVRSMVSVIIFSILFGFFSGTVVSLPPTTIASLGGKPSEIGTRLGMSFTFAAVGLLVGTPVAGTLVNIPEGKFKGAQIFCGATIIGGCALFIAARLCMKPKPKEDKIVTDDQQASRGNEASS